MTVCERATATGTPWTPEEDAVVIEALRQAQGRVVAASRLCQGRILRSEHAIQHRMSGMAELRAGLRPIRRLKRHSQPYTDWQAPATPLQKALALPTLAGVLRAHPRCPSCRGRWWVDADRYGGDVVCWQCGGRVPYRGRE